MWRLINNNGWWIQVLHDFGIGMLEPCSPPSLQHCRKVTIHAGLKNRSMVSKQQLQHEKSLWLHCGIHLQLTVLGQILVKWLISRLSIAFRCSQIVPGFFKPQNQSSRARLMLQEQQIFRTEYSENSPIVWSFSHYGVPPRNSEEVSLTKRRSRPNTSHLRILRTSPALRGHRLESHLT